MASEAKSTNPAELLSFNCGARAVVPQDRELALAAVGAPREPPDVQATVGVGVNGRDLDPSAGLGHAHVAARDDAIGLDLEHEQRAVFGVLGRHREQGFVAPVAVDVGGDGGQAEPFGDTADRVYVDPGVTQYAVSLVLATRDPERFGLPELREYLTFGASPRASLDTRAGIRNRRSGVYGPPAYVV